MRSPLLRSARFSVPCLLAAALLFTAPRAAGAQTGPERTNASIPVLAGAESRSNGLLPGPSRASVTSLSVNWGAAGTYDLTGSARGDLPWLNIDSL